MTPMTTETAALLLAMASNPEQSASPWQMLLPFVFVLGIFYFIILLPMKRRQKKVQQFLEALKVNDRVITSGGIYGTITNVKDDRFVVRIADNTKIEVGKAFITTVVNRATEAKK